jgi:hypothetical protein
MLWRRKRSRRLEDRRGVSGRTVEMPLVDLLQILEHGGHTGLLRLQESEEQAAGRVLIRNGQLAGASFHGLEGRAALARMFDARVLYFDFKPAPIAEDFPKTEPLLPALLDALLLMEERGRLRSLLIQKCGTLQLLPAHPELSVRLSPTASLAAKRISAGEPLVEIIAPRFDEAELDVMRELLRAIRAMDGTSPDRASPPDEHRSRPWPVLTGLQWEERAGAPVSPGRRSPGSQSHPE